mmetsp:Transcript_17448/g.43431  ORF Transcript_17448/g.43431 Transcript_17448/m.43431 type:complete len:385 (-) Transcript_17448:2884-4038(-)
MGAIPSRLQSSHLLVRSSSSSASCAPSARSAAVLSASPMMCVHSCSPATVLRVLSWKRLKAPQSAAVMVQVSALYRATDAASDSYRIAFSSGRSCPLLQMRRSCPTVAVAMPALLVTSPPVLPALSMRVPKYLNAPTVPISPSCVDSCTGTTTFFRLSTFCFSSCCRPIRSCRSCWSVLSTRQKPLPRWCRSALASASTSPHRGQMNLFCSPFTYCRIPSRVTRNFCPRSVCTHPLHPYAQQFIRPLSHANQCVGLPYSGFQQICLAFSFHSGRRSIPSYSTSQPFSPSSSWILSIIACSLSFRAGSSPKLMASVFSVFSSSPTNLHAAASSWSANCASSSLLPFVTRSSTKPSHVRANFSASSAVQCLSSCMVLPNCSIAKPS